MKRILILALLFAALTGCSLAPDTYLSVTEPTPGNAQTVPSEGILVKNYSELKNAILRFVETGQNNGTIRAVNYVGNVEEELTRAAYEIAKLNPVGAYAVDYMTHDCTFIVNYYEISINITFRRTAHEIEQIESISTQNAFRSRLEQALRNGESRLALRMASFRDWDVAEMVTDYCTAHPDLVMEQPKVSVTAYPDSGSVRIVEVDLAWSHSRSELERMKNAVHESIDAAAEYIRYREGDREKLELLFTYLLERFPYAPGETVTPLYDTLCAGVVDATGMAQAWQLICDAAGMECHTVSGLFRGEPYQWNIVGVDGYYRHVDLAQCVLKQGTLQLKNDSEMSDYYWNTEEYPICAPYPEDPIPAEQPTTDEQPPAEELPTPENPPEP